jgi:hypothetical protein
MKSRRKYSDELIAKLVSESQSVAEVLRKLRPDSPLSGTMHRHVTRRIKQANIDITHFLTNEQVLSKYGRNVKLKADEVLVKHRFSQRKEKKETLLRALLSLGVIEMCSAAGCGITTWMGKPIKLHIEHKNGDPLDNRFENLCFLCPNCHSQTTTYAVMNKNR